jgi:hypothetical protein
MSPMLAAIDGAGLLEVVWVSLLAGVGITLTFSLVVLGSGRSSAARRAGRSTAATGYAALAALGLAVFLAGVVFGVNVMLAK